MSMPHECRCGTCGNTMNQFFSPQPLQLAAGHCGKCGAPYTYDYLTGVGNTAFRPICACWNIPKPQGSTGQGGSDAAG